MVGSLAGDRLVGAGRHVVDPGESPGMCGIVGYVGFRAVRPLLLAGLEKLDQSGNLAKTVTAQ